MCCKAACCQVSPYPRPSLQSIVEPAGYYLQQCSNGKEALDWINNHDEWPDLILLDFNMPEMSGGEFLQEVRKFMPSKVVPIIMVRA